MKFSGKGVLITGGTAGIGAGLVVAFARAGARVVFTGRDAERGKKMLREITDAGTTGAFIPLDLRRYDDCAGAIAESERHLGRLDILINNAGIGPQTNVMNATDEMWLNVMATNVNGPFFLSREAAKVMKANGGGVIVNVSSQMARFGNPRSIPYGVSKAALIQMTRAMALDLLPHRIRVNAIAPGGTRTGMLEQSILDHNPDLEEGLKKASSYVPMKRFANVDEVTPAVLFLASDLANYMTGAVIAIDGGTTATGPHFATAGVGGS